MALCLFASLYGCSGGGANGGGSGGTVGTGGSVGAGGSVGTGGSVGHGGGATGGTAGRGGATGMTGGTSGAAGSGGSGAERPAEPAAARAVKAAARRRERRRRRGGHRWHLRGHRRARAEPPSAAACARSFRSTPAGCSSRGARPGADQSGFADSSWRTVNVPHDWAIEGPFSQTAATHRPGRLRAVGDRLVPEALHAPPDSLGPARLRRVRRRDGEQRRLRQRHALRTSPLRLGELPLRHHGQRHLRDDRQRDRGEDRHHHAAGRALLRGRRHLPARAHRGGQSGARRSVGHLRHHAQPRRPPRRRFT